MMVAQTLRPGICPVCRLPDEVGDVTLADRHTPMSICGRCAIAWETPPPDWSTRPPLTCRACENCAFRPGSPERADMMRWPAIQASIAEGAPFRCHKGVPFHIPPGGGDAKFEFDFGGLRAYRICAAWARARLRHVRRAGIALGGVSQ